MGNLYSIRSMLEHLGVSVENSRDPAVLTKAAGLILPGVGSFRGAMDKLNSGGLSTLLKQLAEGGKPLLGICLGMQLLANRSSEGGETEGLKLIDGNVDFFTRDASKPNKKIPHVGFNSVNVKPSSRLLAGLATEPDFYFTHSYCMQCSNDADVSGTADNDQVFVASVEKNNIYGTQFHPELSQNNGLQLMRNYLSICGLTGC